MTTNNKSSRRFLLIPIAAVILAVVLNTFVIICAVVPSVSMAGTIDANSVIIASRLAYSSKIPERGDIVIFESSELDEKNVVKRIIGLPGEHVSLNKGIVYIDGVPLIEDYVSFYPDDSGEYDVPEGAYFVLGDNRNASFDSRFWVDPFVKLGEIKAKVVLKLWRGIEIF